MSRLGAWETFPTFLDDDGGLAGEYRTPLASVAPPAEQGIFYWDGEMHRYAIPDGSFAALTAASAGILVGAWGELRASVDDPDSAHAFATIGGKLTDLGTLGGRFSRALGVDRSGTVVGMSETAQGAVHAFAWKQGTMTDLGTLPGKATSYAWTVDATGKVRGTACDADSALFNGTALIGCHAVAFGAAGVSDLGALPEHALLTAMSPTGHVLGVRLTSDAGRAFVWRDGALVDVAALAEPLAWPRLGLRDGKRLSTELAGENVAGDAVGALWVPISEGESSLAILLHGGTLLDLNALADTTALLDATHPLKSAIAIDVRGRILAVSTHPLRTFLLTPR